MKVIIEKYIYARKTPGTEQTAAYYRNPGEVLDVDAITVGEQIEGNSIWYHNSEDGCYYWSGGMNATDEVMMGVKFSFEEELNVYKSALNHFIAYYRDFPNVKGLAIGYKEINLQFQFGLTLVFYVYQKQTLNNPKDNIPSSIHYNGIEINTDVRELGMCSLASLPNPDSNPPYLMGGSISEVRDGKINSFGTRTILVEKGGKNYLLTCFHVACDSLLSNGQKDLNNAKIRVLFPSPQTIQSKKTVYGSVKYGMINTLMDYALIEVDNPEMLTNNMPQRAFTNFYSFDMIKENTLKGTQFVKYGAKTKDSPIGTFNTFISNEVTIDDQLNLKMSGLVEMSKMSDKGDSGAPVIDMNGYVLGYIIADAPKSTFVLPIAQLIKELSITIIK